MSWLESNNNGATLYSHMYASGYAASREGPGNTQSWDDFWQVLSGAGRIISLPAADAAGNTIAYTIQRLCNSSGSPSSGAGCSSTPATLGAQGSSKGAGVVQLQFNGQVYYRITARVAGARSSVGYVQVIVAL